METAESKNIQEVLRYLGYRAEKCDETIVSQIAQVSKEAQAEANAKNVFGVWDCKTGTDTVVLGDMNINSRDLARHLGGCSRVVLLAATLGTGADAVMRKLSAQDMEKALIAQAVFTVMIENYCDTVVCEASKNPLLGGLYPTSRFSPGYGDFDIVWQKDMLKLLDCEKRIALTLTDGCMLVPSKSVTALVGFGKERTHDIEEKCLLCTNKKCEYRKVQ